MFTISSAKPMRFFLRFSANFKVQVLSLTMKHYISSFAGLLCLITSTVSAQPDRWQQRVNYQMKIKMDVTTNRFTGTQKLDYTNNSPDTLTKLFYHLYFNAFQPNSAMDQRSRQLGQVEVNGRPDWDPRVQDRIYNLKPDEIGYQKIISLTMNGASQPFKVFETILEVDLTKPILPHTTVALNMNFEAQVPLQVRRSGRDNPSTGVRYSMSQWYPKLCEYDYEGWHPTTYIAREFYGVWGDYDVSITIDKNYLVGGTGYLDHPEKIGFGYEASGTKVPQSPGKTLTWHFTAPNVHDFMWAADPEYKHLSKATSGGTTINVIYNRDEKMLADQFAAMPAASKSGVADASAYIRRWDEQWQTVLDAAVTVLPFIELKFGKYPYKQYSFVHGGDGGMEYPMSTLINGPGLGTAFHEWMHTWYQMMMGTNESLYPWMDEGFTSYASSLVSRYYQFAKANPELTVEKLRVAGKLSELDSLMFKDVSNNIHGSAYNGYFALVKSGLEEPMTTHSDHYETNFAYSIAAYSKGEVFLDQLGYIIGAATRDKVLLEYYRLWHFKHPNANDFIRVAEKVSNIKLDWYREYWVNTTKTIDYGIDSLWEEGGKTNLRIKKTGKMPMPVDVQINFKDGSKELHYVPLNLMFGAKEVEDKEVPRISHEPWMWPAENYVISIAKPLNTITTVEIDPKQRTADVNRKDNKLEIKW